jgi:hypothetical protein
VSSQKLFLQQSGAGDRLLSAWFDDERFRAAWVPAHELFARPDQKAIARVCAARGGGLTRDALVFQLHRADQLKLFENGAEGVLATLSAPTALDPWKLVEELRELAGSLLLLERLRATQAELERGEGLGAARTTISTALRDADFASGMKARTVRESVQVAYQRATERDRKPGIRTISAKLDRVTGGIQPDTVWLLAAATSWGKSSFIVATADRALRDGYRPLIVTVEDPEIMFGRRLLQKRSNANALRVREGNLNDDEYKRLTAEMAAAEDVPWLLPAVGRSAEAIAADIRSLVASEAIDFVMVDYVQRIRTATKQQDRRNQVNYVGELLTDAIKESRVGGILFSQLTQDASTGKLRARESEDLHNSAEVLMFGTREREKQLDKHTGHARGESETKKLFVEKVKEGPAGFSIELPWNEHSASFISDYDTPDGVLRFPQQTDLQLPPGRFDDEEDYA